MDVDKTLSFVATAQGNYVVEKRWSLNLAREFATDATEPGRTWNNLKAKDADIIVGGAAVFNNFLTEDNQASTLSLSNSAPFDGASNGLSSYTSAAPVYPIVAVNSGFQVTGDTGLAFTGADPAKFYQIYILSSVNVANSALNASVGAITATHNSSNNYPTDGDNRYSSGAMMTLNNVKPDVDGKFTIALHKAGDYYLTAVNLILIEQSNIAKS